MIAFAIFASFATGMALGWAAACVCIRKREARRTAVAFGADIEPIDGALL